MRHEAHTGAGRLRRSVAVIVLLLLVALDEPVNAATKTAGAFAYVTRTKSFDGRSGAVKAQCPGESRATGAGGGVRGRNGELSGTAFIDGKDEDTTVAEDRTVASARWSGRRGATVKAVAVCLDEGGLRFFNRLSTQIEPGQTLVRDGVVCPAGYTLIGGGGGVSDQAGRVFSSFPTGGTWRIGAQNVTDTTRTLEVFSNCYPTGVRDIEIVSSGPIPLSEDVAVDVAVLCPVDMHVSSGGMASSGPARGSGPVDSDDAGRVPDDGWGALVAPTAGGGNAQAFAICVGEPI